MLGIHKRHAVGICVIADSNLCFFRAAYDHAYGVFYKKVVICRNNARVKGDTLSADRQVLRKIGQKKISKCKQKRKKHCEYDGGRLDRRHGGWFIGCTLCAGGRLLRRSIVRLRRRYGSVIRIYGRSGLLVVRLRAIAFVYDNFIEIA